MPRAPLLICFLVGLGCWATMPAAAAKTNVLYLHPHDQTLPASARVAGALTKRLTKAYGQNIDIYAEYLDKARFPDAHFERLMGQFIAEKYGPKGLSLIVALGTSSLQFALDRRDAIGASTPIVYCCVRSPAVPNLKTSENVFGIVSDYDVRETVALARRLQPKASELLLISGASEIDRIYEAEARQSLEQYHSGLTVQYLGGPPLNELLRKVSNVPPDTIILFLNFLMDGDGKPQVPQQVAQMVAQAATAPTYGIFDTLLGTGIVGGYMDTFEKVGEAAADLAIQVMAGVVPAQQRVHLHSDRNFFVDARQLERWGLLRSNLPPETIVHFDRPTIWDTYRREVVAAMFAFGVVMLALIILLIQVRRRVSAEAHLRESEERLNFAAASGGIGLWQYDTSTSELWSSEHCRAIFGLPPSARLTTEGLLRCVHPEDRGIAAASVRAATYGPQAETLLEFRIVRPDGEIRSIEGRGHSTLDANGNAIRVSGIFRDLTAYRAIEKEAKDLSRSIVNIQDEERKRIAQELHDSTAQHLAAVKLNLMALAGALNSVEERVHLFAEIRGSLTAAMQELRTFTYLLYPQELGHRGLQEVLPSYIEGFRQRTGLATTLRSTENLDDLPLSLQQSLLRIVQESLANVHRHASASRVAVKLQRRGNRVHLLIADNGVGLQGLSLSQRNNGSALPLGVGIPGMAARARQLGGQLDVRSRSSGTLVHASLPIDDDAPSDSPLTKVDVRSPGTTVRNGNGTDAIFTATRHNQLRAPARAQEQRRSL